MAEISTRTFTDLVRGQAAAIQARAAGLVDFAVGSILRAIAESIAAVVLWLQGLILALLAATRAATSTGVDLDSWMADYGVIRLPAQGAVGEVTFGRFTATAQAIIPVGATVETADGSQQYAVTVDTTNAAYNAGLGGYVMAAAISSLTVPVAAVAAGAAGNAVAGAVNTITQALPGVDTVVNADDFAEGADAETDAALRARFVSYLASLSKATVAAVGYAIASLQQGLTYTISENVTYSGTAQNGHFSIVVDDGTGSPSSDLLSAVYSAVDLVRPVGSSFEVHGPTVVTATVVMSLTVAAGYLPSAVASTVQAAVEAYINSLPLGAPLPYSRLAQVAYDASAGVINVSGVTVNSGTADIVTTAKQVIKHGSDTVTAS